jgi:hypothetical protein
MGENVHLLVLSVLLQKFGHESVKYILLLKMIANYFTYATVHDDLQRLFPASTKPYNN